jgi:hypothetical protein
MLVGLLLSLAIPAGCGTLLYPQRSGLSSEDRGGIDWDAFMGDLFLTAGLGLVPDFIHGTIWLPRPGYSGPARGGLFTRPTLAPPP